MPTRKDIDLVKNQVDFETGENVDEAKIIDALQLKNNDLTEAIDYLTVKINFYFFLIYLVYLI